MEEPTLGLCHSPQRRLVFTSKLYSRVYMAEVVVVMSFFVTTHSVGCRWWGDAVFL